MTNFIIKVLIYPIIISFIFSSCRNIEHRIVGISEKIIKKPDYLLDSNFKSIFIIDSLSVEWMGNNEYIDNIIKGIKEYKLINEKEYIIFEDDWMSYNIRYRNFLNIDTTKYKYYKYLRIKKKENKCIFFNYLTLGDRVFILEINYGINNPYQEQE